MRLSCQTMERKKRKFLFWVLIAGLCCVAVLVILYACLAFIPTGYEEVAQSIEPAKQNVSRLMAPRITPGADSKQPQAPEGRASIPNAPPSESLGPVHKLTFYEELLSYEGSWLVTNPRIEKYLNIDSVQELAYSNGMPVFMTTFLVDDPLSASLSALGAKQREELIHGAKLWISRRWGQMEFGPDGYEFRPKRTGREQRMNPYLDQLEEFLLRPRWDLSAPTVPVRWTDIRNFHYKAMVAIMRASLRGDQERAVLLLDRYFEAIRLMQLFYLQNPEVTRETVQIDLGVFWLNLASLSDFPAEGWEHAAKGVEALHFSKEEVADLRHVRAIARRNSLVRKLDPSRAKTKQNTWHYFGGGAPESVVGKALYPLAVRRIDRMARCEYDGDLKGYTLNCAGLASLLSMMNNAGTWNLNNIWPEKLIGYEAVTYAQARPRDCRAPESLAIERFPKFVFEPRPPVGGMLDPDEEWARLHGYRKDSPLGRFYAKYQHEPDTPEEVQAILRETGNDAALSAAVKWFSAQKYIVCWNPIVKSPLNKNHNVAVRIYHPGVIVWDEVKAAAAAGTH